LLVLGQFDAHESGDSLTRGKQQKKAGALSDSRLRVK